MTPEPVTPPAPSVPLLAQARRYFEAAPTSPVFDTDDRGPNRAQRRDAQRRQTLFGTWIRGHRVTWRPTQVPKPVRIARARRRSEIARASRKANR